ncbi:hypothetical protein [Rhizorhabdus dicambivorans]|uniref:Uncharacterized protein n=2 Tax=Rhizorhabdus dicambivorans TaxID=1850238 RepID=A0A2A4G056_9SPHN|nr:hypothetical protein [Rhizorhabdus dicambivorans]ATE65962.1 hypothetical protein CMV14_17410 [Rhizorhabdus dicambivorans]PCE43077.1 hypothetical protein COO09_07195 [Rhizorhabdus dicambivorans]
MRRSLIAGLILLALPACGKEEATAPEPAEGGGPQIATSLEDYALPTDKSDQITAIDAATGDGAGMPRDGGAVVRTAKPDARPAVEPSAENATAPVAAPPPLVMPPPVTQPAPPPAGN